MILDVLCYRNKKMKCYANPLYTQEKLDNIEVNVTRAIIAGGHDGREKMKGLALYHLGTFNDESGQFSLLPEAELLFDCDDIIAGLPEE